ncbi:MAG: acyltransferase domain-containing protein [Synergistaceae bacterium]
MDGQEIKETLQKIEKVTSQIKETTNHKKAKIIFVFPGQGSSGAVPLDHLMQHLPVFKKYIEKADEILKKQNIDIKAILKKGKTETTPQEQAFSIVYGTAMAKQYIAYGIKPDAMIGHSVGEISAYAIAEMLPYEKAVTYAYKRAVEMDKITNKGVMMAVQKPYQQTTKEIENYTTLSLASINDELTCVISGDIKEIKKLEINLDKQEIKHKRLRVHIAAHSSLLEPTLKNIDKIEIGEIEEPQIPIYSTITGDRFTMDILRDPQWKSKHCRNTVEFLSALKKIKKDNAGEKMMFIEFSVHRVLAPSGMKTIKDSIWLGCSSMSKYRELKSTEYCFSKGIEETLETIKKQIT